jgi:hypothetical protein
MEDIPDGVVDLLTPQHSCTCHCVMQTTTLSHMFFCVPQSLGGMEDIPDGVVALLTRSSTDVLSHVAIRARTQGVLLAGCSDEEEWQHLLELQVSVCSSVCATLVSCVSSHLEHG